MDGPRAAPCRRHHDPPLQSGLQILSRLPHKHGPGRHGHEPRYRQEGRPRDANPSPYLNFEFQGGEPTVNMDVIKFVVDYSREKNKYEKKILDHSLVTNMTYMNEETLTGSWTTTS